MQGIPLFFRRKKLFWLLCYPAALLCLAAAKKSPYIAEELFAKRIYRVLSVAISSITGHLPFSLAELVLVICPAAAAGLIAVYIVKMIKNKERRFFLAADVLLNLCIAAGILLLLYELGCGINYHRYPISHYMGFAVEESTKEELYGLCVSLAEKTNAAREALGSANENGQGIYCLNMPKKELSRKAKEAYQQLAEQYSIFSGFYPGTKSVYFSNLLSRMGITGIFIPFTMEANVNIDIPDYSIASTMCHELAHLHGFMREDEANYIAYLACISAEDPELHYSGYMEALIIAGNALYRKDSDLYDAVRLLYTEAVRRDLAANSLYWRQFEGGRLTQAAEAVNHAYLKANAQEDGIQSYGRMVDLLLAEYRLSNGN